jgi:hypothetical protein
MYGLPNTEELYAAATAHARTLGAQAQGQLDLGPAGLLSPPAAPERRRIFFSPTTNQFSAGGVTVDGRDIQSLQQLPRALEAPQGEDPVEGDWQEIGIDQLQGYLGRMGERRGVMGNIGLGARQTAEGLISGTGRLAGMMGAEGVEEALTSVGSRVGPDEFEQQRSALIRENNTLFQNIMDAAAQGSVSFVTSIVGGGLGGLAVRGSARALGMTASRGAQTAGAFAGSAATIFPMELESSYQAALQGGYDVNDPQVNQEMLGAAFAKTIAQTLAPAMLSRGFSRRFLGELNDVGQRVATNALQRAAGSRAGYAAGIGLTEALAEGLAELIDRTSFDPEFRKLLNASDMKALVPHIVDRYGEDIVIAMGAGAMLGGGIGAVTPRPGLATPESEPRDLLNNPPAESTDLAAPAEPMDLQGLPAPDAPAGLLPPPTPTDPLALPGPPRALLGPSVMVTPPPVQDAGPIVTPPPGAIPMPGMPEGLEGPVAQGFQQAAAAGPSYVVPTPLAPTPVIEQAPITQQPTAVPPGAARLRQRPSEREAPAATPEQPAATPLARPAAPAVLPEGVVGTATGRPFKNRPSVLAVRNAAKREGVPESRLEPIEVDGGWGLRVLPEETPPPTPTRKPLRRTKAAPKAEALKTRTPEPEASDIAQSISDADSTPKELRNQKSFKEEYAQKAGRNSALWENAALKEAAQLADWLGARTQSEWDLINPVFTNDLNPFKNPASIDFAAAQAKLQAAIDAGKPTPPGGGSKSDTLRRKPASKKPEGTKEAKLKPKKPEPKSEAPAAAPPTPPAPTRTLQERVDALSDADLLIVQRRLEAIGESDIDAAIINNPDEVEAALGLLRRTAEVARRTEAERAAAKAAEDAALERKAQEDADKQARAAEAAAQREADRQAAAAEAEQTRGTAPQTKTSKLAPFQEAVDLLSDPSTDLTADMSEATENAILELAEYALSTDTNDNRTKIKGLGNRTYMEVAQEALAAAIQKSGEARAVVAETVNSILEGEPLRATFDKGANKGEFRPEFQFILETGLAANLSANNITLVQDHTADSRAAMNSALTGASLGSSEAQILGGQLQEALGNALAGQEVNAKYLRELVAELKAKHKDYYNTLPVSASDTRLIKGFITDLNQFRRLRGKLEYEGRFSLNDFTTGRDAVSLDNKPLKPMSTGQAKLVGTKFLSRFAVRPNVSYFRDQADLKRKAPELYARAVAARPQGDFDSAQAAGYFFGGDNVIIFTDRIVTADQLRTVIAHEALGHMGIRAVIPEGQVTAVMDSIYNSDEGLALIVDEQVEAFGMTRAEATEEYLSSMAARIDGNILLRWWNAIKGALNKLGLQFRDDEARHLMSQARRYLRTGEQSSFFDPERMAYSVMEMNLGRDPDGDGRFALASQQQPRPLDDSRSAADRVYAVMARPENVYEAAQNLRDYATNKNKIVTDFNNYVDSFKANIGTPTQWRSTLNEGFSILWDLLNTRQQRASQLVLKYQKGRSVALQPLAEVPITGGALPFQNTKTQISSAGQLKVGKALAANRIVKSFRYKLPKNLRNQSLLTLNTVDGTYSVNRKLADTLKKQGRLTREQFAGTVDGEGVEVSIEQAVPMTDEFRQQLADERDTLLVGVTDPKEIDRITAEYDALMQQKNYMGVSTREEKITFTDVEWKSFEQELDTLVESELDVLNSQLLKFNEERNNTFDVLKRSMKEPMTKGDRSLIDTMVQRYYEIAYGNVNYNDAGMRIASSVDIARAEEFAKTLNKVILDAEKVDALFGGGGFLPDSDRTTVTEQVKGLQSRLNLPKKTGDTKLDQGRFVVQNQVKQLANQLISTTDAERSAMRNISTGYTPFMREGEYQVSLTAQDDAGKTYQLTEEYREQMVYMQFDLESAANEAAKMIGDTFGDKKYSVQAFDPSADNGRGAIQTMQLKLVPAVGVVKQVSSSDPELNLNESIRFLRRFSIDLTPSKTEDVIVALMNQNDRAMKRRLRAAFTPGQSQNMTKAISQLLETRASVVSRNETAVALANIMDITPGSPAREKWFGSQEKYDQLKSKYERLKAAPGVNADQLDIAQKEFARYHSQFVTNNAPVRGGGFHNEAGNLLNFLDRQRSVMETDLDAGPLVSRARFFTSVALLGASFATGFLNPVGMSTNVPAALGTRSESGFGGGFGMGRAYATLAQTYKAVGMPGLSPSEKGRRFSDPDFYEKLSREASDAELKRMGISRNEAAFLAEGVARGDFRAAQFDSLRGSARGNITSGLAQKFLDTWMFWFNVTEQSTRRATGLAAYRLEYSRRVNAGQSVGEADAASKKFAYELVNFTLGDYTTKGRPAVFRGGLPSLAYTFKQWPVNTAVLLKALPLEGKLWMGASLIVLSGLRGLPFAEDVEDVVDTIMQKMGLKTASVRAWAIKEFDKVAPGFGQVMMTGLVNRALPSDLGVRTSVGNILPGTGMGLAGADPMRELMEIFGPVASTAQSTVATLDNIISAANPNTPGSWGTVLRNTPFTMLNAWSDAYAYAQNGAIVDKRGYVVSRDYHAGTILARVLGFYPRAASDQYEGIRMARRVSDYQREISIGYRDAAVNAIVQGDRAEAQRIFEAVREWNQSARGSGLEVQNFGDRVQRAVKAQRLLASERLLNASPITARPRMREIMESLGTY